MLRLAKGDEAKDIPTPARHKEAVETFTTVASNLSELAQVSLILLLLCRESAAADEI